MNQQNFTFNNFNNSASNSLSDKTIQESDQEQAQQTSAAIVGNDFSIMTPTNYTDPFVYHDPSIQKSYVAKLNQPQYPTNLEDNLDDQPEVGNNEPYDTVMVEGIKWPIIKVNNIVIRHEAILNMVIYYTGFYPRLLLTIADFENHIEFADIPGPNNVITVVMLPSLQNVYKAISIDFYIDYVDFDTQRRIITYTATYKFIPFEQKKTVQLKYPGCSSHLGKTNMAGQHIDEEVSCNQDKQQKPNTWEYLHMICMETGLGFASTDKVQNIQDRLPRIINNMTFKEYIEDQMAMSGVDEDSVFDCWIDLYRYLVVVNVSYEMSEKISFRQLAINASLGINGTDNNAPKQRTKYVHRTLTNYSTTQEPSDLTFVSENFKEVVDTSLLASGYDQQNNTMVVRGCADDGTAPNSIIQVDHHIEVNSIDGQERADFATSVTNPCTVRVDKEYDTNNQRKIRKNFFDKLRARRYEVILDKPNFGLNRGTLVNVAFFTAKTNEKQIVVEQADNIVGSTSGQFEVGNANLGNGVTTKDLIVNEQVELPVSTKSGFYYIDGMEFMYDNRTEEIRQKLILIRREFETSFQNKMSSPKVDGNVLGTPNPQQTYRTTTDMTNHGYPPMTSKQTSDTSEYTSEADVFKQQMSRRLQGYDSNYNYFTNMGGSDYLFSSDERAKMSSLGISFDSLLTAYKPTDEDRNMFV